jgi:hypothetical protein
MRALAEIEHASESVSTVEKEERLLFLSLASAHFSARAGRQRAAWALSRAVRGLPRTRRPPRAREHRIVLRCSSHRGSAMSEVIRESLLTCPACNQRQCEVMPVDACLYFYECTRCAVLLKPKAGDCCVFCSYGTVKCPPKQVRGGDCGCAA